MPLPLQNYGISAAGNEFENRKVLEAAVAASSSSSTYFGQQIENHHHHSPLAKEHQGGNSVKALSQFIDSGFQYTILQPLLILLLLVGGVVENSSKEKCSASKE